MKMKTRFFLLALALLLRFTPSFFAEEVAASAPKPDLTEKSKIQEKEYYDATVLLVDHENGLLGIKVLNEETNQQEKLSFKVDPEEVYVTNNLNHSLDFSDIAVGDKINIYAEVDKKGQVMVDEIVDNSRMDEDAV